jgi:prolyl-tRNA editing enzyme YbaK/EbsC (Cys-tRNA(Pro) deacylase)
MCAVWSIAGTLQPVPVQSRLDLVAKPVADALAALDPADADRCAVAEIDPTLADTAEFCAFYGSPLSASANCVVVAGKRGDVVRYAACLVLATTRADVNGVVRRRLDARKASFAPMDDAVELTGMAYGGITPIGLPLDWPVLLSAEVAAAPELVIGSVVRHSKLLVPGDVLAKLPGAEVLADLARPA